MSLARGNICQWTTMSTYRKLEDMSTETAIPSFAAGLYLQRLRDSKGLLQKDVAHFASVNTRTIKRWEAGLSKPSVDTLRPLLDKIGGSFDEFSALWELKPGTVEDTEAAIRRTLGNATVDAINQKADVFTADMTDEEIAEIIVLGRRLQKEDRVHWIEQARHLLKRAAGRSDVS